METTENIKSWLTIWRANLPVFIGNGHKSYCIDGATIMDRKTQECRSFRMNRKACEKLQKQGFTLESQES